MTGREITPFILSRLNELTQGESLRLEAGKFRSSTLLANFNLHRANLALVRNNAKIGADIAVELTKLRSSHQIASKHSSSSSTESRGPLVVGGSIFDFVVRLKEGEVSLRPLHLLRYTSMAAHIEAPLPPVMEVLVEMWHLLSPGAKFATLKMFHGVIQVQFYVSLITESSGSGQVPVLPQL